MDGAYALRFDNLHNKVLFLSLQPLGLSGCRPAVISNCSPIGLCFNQTEFFKIPATQFTFSCFYSLTEAVLPIWSTLQWVKSSHNFSVTSIIRWNLFPHCLESGLTWRLALTNRMWQKWHPMTSKSWLPKALKLLLSFSLNTAAM